MKTDTHSSPSLRWDIFCRVIDNHGDLGVCWRLCADLAKRGHTVRLWVDDASALAWMAPQGCINVEVCAWPNDAVLQVLAHDEAFKVGHVVIEAFGCELPVAFQAMMVQKTPPVWINLEYLSAENYVERAHGLPSPVMSGPAKGHTKWFFYPGFTHATGGLLREPDLSLRQNTFKSEAWLAQLGLPLRSQARRISLFCYEPPGLATWLEELKQGSTPTDLLVAPGRPLAAIQAALERVAPGHWRPNASITYGNLNIHPLPYLTQQDFDHLLWSCHLNMVRGEDSLIRALWAGKPLIWHIYPQEDNAHHAKLDAFLNWLNAPSSLREFHHAWNGLRSMNETTLNMTNLNDWAQTLQSARAQLLQEKDLVSQLLNKIQETINF